MDVLSHQPRSISDRVFGLGLRRLSLMTKVQAERERCARIAEAEPELPGPIPNMEVFRVLPLEEVLRATVRATKRSIARAIRAQENS